MGARFPFGDSTHVTVLKTKQDLKEVKDTQEKPQTRCECACSKVYRFTRYVLSFVHNLNLNFIQAFNKNGYEFIATSEYVNPCQAYVRY